jgi:uncharacterized protein with HEPN domain
MTDKRRRIADWLRDIRQAIDYAKEDVGAMSKKEFLADGKTQRAVIESIIVIGEASNRVMRLEPSIETATPELWMQLREAYQMRNLVTHEYHRADAAVVWDTVKIDLPLMDGLVSAYLGNADEES